MFASHDHSSLRLARIRSLALASAVMLAGACGTGESEELDLELRMMAGTDGTTDYGTTGYGSYGSTTYGSYGSTTYGSYGSTSDGSYGSTSDGSYDSTSDGGYGSYGSYGSTSYGTTGYGSTSYGSTSYGSTSYGSTTGYGSTSYGSTSYGSTTGYGSTAYGSTSYGSTTGYGSTSYGSTTGYGYDGSTGDPDEPDMGTTTIADLGEECVPICDEPPEECCLPACDAEVGPAQGDPTTFNCPVAGMEYNCNLPGTDLFDCDDFAYACEMWGRNNGINICQYYMSYTRANGTTGAHQINIVEFEYAIAGMQKYCFIEPQSNTSYVCWIQPEGEPSPPNWAKNQACTAVGGAGATCNSSDVQCDGVPSPNSGEVCFNTLPAVCSMFRNETGLCPYTFEPDHDCSGTDGTGDDCYWNCADDEVCGAACNQCDPAPGGSTGEMVEYCSDIDGENLNCFWECSGGQTCGDECYVCW